VLLLLLTACALAQVELADMQRESRWLRMSAEKLYTYVVTPFGAEWQYSVNDRDSFLKRARQFESAWTGRDATVDSTRADYQKVRKSFDKVKLYARVNMNAQEVDNIERMLQRLDVVYGINPAQEATP
jgi:hypothetical protein